MRISCCALCLLVLTVAALPQQQQQQQLSTDSAGQRSTSSAPSTPSTNSGNIPSSALGALGRVYNQCESASDIIKCFKMQAIKLAGRAIRVQNIKLIDGVAVVRRSNFRESRTFHAEQQRQNANLDGLSAQRIDEMLWNAVRMLVESHQLQINVPRLITYGSQEVAELIEEGRGKGKKKKYLGPFLAALAMKAGILKMAYHSIAIVAGKALIIGKIALIISAIIGLKKLVTTEGHEKTTYEIVKHPHVQQSHSYSSSSGDFEQHDGGSSGGGSGQYHRSLGDEEMLMQDRVYRAHVPRS